MAGSVAVNKSAGPIERLIDRNAEQAVNGAILIDQDAMLHVADVLSPDDFYDERARWVYEAASSLYGKQEPIDPLTMCAELERNKHLNQIGGSAYLTELIMSTPTSLNVSTYAATVSRLATLRKLLKIAGDIAGLAYKANGERTEAILDKVRGLVDSVTPMTSTEDVLLWLDSLEQFIDGQLVRNARAAEREAGIVRPALALPWRAFDRFKLKLRPGTLAIVVADSSVGKTTFMECCAEHWARQGHRVAFFHLELSHQMMLDRRMCRLSGVPIDQIEEGAEAAIPRIIETNARLRDYTGGITYVHCPGWSARAIATKARQLHAKGLCDVGIVDYLQKLRLYRPGGSSEEHGLSDATEVLKNTAEQLGNGWMMGSQVNRKADGALRVRGSHIRGSGSVPAKGNITVTLAREIDQETGDLSPVISARVDKNTMGPTGDTQLAIRGEKFQITDVALLEEQ
jgi:replicative DNA helicase